MKSSLLFSAELVPVAYVEALLGLAAELGVSRGELFALAAIAPQALDNPSGRMSFVDANLLASAALQHCHEPALGLLLGQRLNVSTHGILGYAVLASANLGQAIQFVLKYYRVLGLAFDLDITEQSGRLQLRALESMPMGPLKVFASEALLASFYSIARFLLGRELDGLELGFAHSAPAHAARYQAVFGVTVQFDQPYDWLSLPQSYLQQPMALANPGTVHMCEQQCEALLATLDVRDDLLTRVRRLLLARPGDFPDLQNAASSLHTSARSLRRHLSELGTSYQQVLDDVRKRLALQYLTTTHLPLHEIAYLLNFSDPSNFRRAFKKWTGKSPGEYRREH